MTQLLVVDDDRGFATLLRSCLETEGYEVRLAAGVVTGLASVAEHDPDLVILDLDLAGEDGFDMLKTLRSANNEVPVLVLTGRSSAWDKQRGFDLGADDFLTKPTPIRALLASIKALLRRSRTGERAGPSWVCIGDISLHPPTRSVRRQHRLVHLRPREYELLMALFRQRGQAVSRDDLLRTVWSVDPARRSRALDSTIVSLRRKLEPTPRRPRHILTVPGYGYMLSRREPHRSSATADSFGGSPPVATQASGPP